MRQPWKARWWFGLGLALLICPSLWGEEGPAYLVKDIELSGVPFVIYDEFGSPSSYWYGATPRQLTEYRTALLFVARDVAHGFELWRSDGTEEGTFLVKDLCPGPCSSDLYLLGEYRGHSYFIGNDGVTGRELWRTDGTEAGTGRVTDLCPGACGLAPSRNELNPFRTSWAVLNDVLYFSASNSERSQSLWRTDGTAAGTSLLKAFCTLDPSCSPNGGASTFAAYQGKLYFNAGDGRDFELWVSDGTTAGTYELMDFCGPFSNGGSPRHFHEFRGELYFVSSCGPGSATSIFKTNGTVEGTVHLVGFNGHYNLSGPFVELGNLLFFGIGGQLWRTDGTPQGTYGVADFGQLGRISALGDKLVLPAETVFGSGDATLFVSDGTGDGTFEIPHAEFASGLGLYVFDGKALFSGGHTPPGGPIAGELWVTDGTSEGTQLLQEIFPGPIGSDPVSFQQVGSRIFFIASEPTHHTELWALPRSVLTGPRCFTEPTKLCFQDNRFEVSVRFKNQHAGGAEGVGQAASWSDQSGTFTFFNPENTELVVKVLDGRALTGSFWFFFGALSNVEYWIDVKDWQTGVTRTYHNPPGEICGGAFLNDFPAAAGAQAADGQPAARAQQGGHGGPPLQLMDGRLAVSVHWRNQRNGAEGEGTVLSGNGKTGFFSFFNPGNIELTVKALDGTAVNGRIWFFYGALSDVEYWIRVKDTQTGAEKTYHNPPGRICGVGDTAAL